MSSEDVYIKFLQKVNKNYTNDNISVDRGRFVLLYNEAQNKFLEWVLEKRNEDDIRDVQLLVVPDKKLKFQRTLLNHEDFKLPKDFFSFANIQIKASTDDCKNKEIFVYEVKQENINELLADDNNKPSFLFRDTFYTFSKNNISIYVDKFSISKVYMTYYRYPLQLDIKGYIRLDGEPSKQVDPELDDKLVDRIITLCAKDFNLNNDNLNRLQVDKDRIISKV